MAPKPKSQYVCQSCGSAHAKWVGRCPACNEWNQVVEEAVAQEDISETSLGRLREEVKLFRSDQKNMPRNKSNQEWEDLLLKDETQNISKPSTERISTGIGELDRVLGGGLVRDSFVLLGGDPGIGKSTLLLQMATGLAAKQSGKIKILYCSGEESIEQIRSRAKRLATLDTIAPGQISVAAETRLERVFSNVKELKPDVLIIDSLQTFSCGFLESAPGSVSQVREVTARLMTLAKSAGIAVWIVGHVTKEGGIAGPKTVEHMVDTVLYFEGEPSSSYRLLRTVKNRFGSTRELGVFEMAGEGLQEVLNPSSLFLSDRDEPVAGTAVAASLEGARPLLIELQALVAPSALAMPRRTAVGMETARLSVLTAIIDRHMRLSLAEKDLFFNVAGGLKLSEPAADLAAAAAIFSSASGKPTPKNMAFIGELALTGEVRAVSQLDARIEECEKLGFKSIVVPQANLKAMKNGPKREFRAKLIPIARVAEIATFSDIPIDMTFTPL